MDPYTFDYLLKYYELVEFKHFFLTAANLSKGLKKKLKKVETKQEFINLLNYLVSEGEDAHRKQYVEIFTQTIHHFSEGVYSKVMSVLKPLLPKRPPPTTGTQPKLNFQAEEQSVSLTETSNSEGSVYKPCFHIEEPSSESSSEDDQECHSVGTFNESQDQGYKTQTPLTFATCSPDSDIPNQISPTKRLNETGSVPTKMEQTVVHQYNYYGSSYHHYYPAPLDPNADSSKQSSTLKHESCLGPGDLKVVLKELFVIRPKWRHLGLELDITPSTLDAIEQEYSALEDRLERVLLEWLKKGSATWKMLVEDTLLSPLIGEIMLAQRLRERYCPRGTMFTAV